MSKKDKKPTIVGNPVILVVDIFESHFHEEGNISGIPAMPGKKQRMEKAADIVKNGRDAGIPIVVIHEIHRKDGIDFGRELDGAEGEHCIEDPNNPQLPVKGMGMTDKDYVVYKRRYSAFFGTDLEILLKGLQADTLILVGVLTDICVHFTFTDAHQHDYYCRVVEDCVSGSNYDAHQAALNNMEYMQSGAVVSSDDIIKQFKAYKKPILNDTF